MTVLGTRPEIIRLSRVIANLDRFTDHVLVHTGQNYDYELNEIFFRELGLRNPDIVLDSDTSSLGGMLGSILASIESVLRDQRPDAVLILGDTNSSIAGIMAKRLKIPLYHMEAGNRCFDPNVPEEVNRKIIDRIADFNLVYSEHARRHLLSEGMPHRRIYLTGSPMFEVLEHYSQSIANSTILDELDLQPHEYMVASVHREENVDSKQNLLTLLEALQAASERYDMQVFVSTHPRTRKRLGSLGYSEVDQRVKFLKPFGFFDYIKMQKNSFCTMSDSGTISEESAILQFPAITIRKSMERPEALDTGSIVLSGLNTDVILESIDIVTGLWRDGIVPEAPAEYRIPNVSQRVLNLIVGTSRLSNSWDGVQKHDYD
jgi:UDP-N-acetylglucosamine 2-epimerase (non-hydrolysing)